MTSREAVVTLLVAVIGSGGLWVTVQKVVDALAKRRSIREVDPEAFKDKSVDRMSRTLLSMERSLRAAERRAEAAESRVHELEQQIDQLEVALDNLRRQLSDATVQLNQANNQLATLRDLLPPRTEPQA